MKNKINAFDLLDREKVWEWGTSQRSFDTSLSEYLQAIQETGRPLAHSDRYSKWRRSYRFNQRYRNVVEFEKLSAAQQDSLRSAPYFLVDLESLKLTSVADRVVSFVKTTGRRPNCKVLRERDAAYALSTIYRRAKAGDLPTYIEKILSSAGISLKHHEARWEANVQNVIRFVRTHSRIPVCYSPIREEHRLGIFLSGVRRQKRKGKLTLGQIEDIESLPGFEWEPSSGPRGPK
jgi:hypothetical protein